MVEEVLYYTWNLSLMTTSKIWKSQVFCWDHLMGRFKLVLRHVDDHFSAAYLLAMVVISCVLGSLLLILLLAFISYCLR